MINTYLLDDEPLALELLFEDVAKVPYIEIVGKSTNPREAINEIGKLQPQLLISDIQMPGIIGLDVVKSLTYSPCVIFLTAFSQYAVDGFELEIIDYLLKPVRYERLIQSLERVRNKIDVAQVVQNQQKPSKKIVVKVNYQDYILDLDTVLYIEAQRDYVRIVTSESEKPVLTQVNLKRMEAMVHEAGFVKVHRSFIINPKYIKSTLRSRVQVGNYWLPIGDLFRKSFFDFWNG